MGHHKAAILLLARTVRAAETDRIEDGRRALALYDEALHERSESAVAYLKAVKAADEKYQTRVRLALGDYATAIHGEPQSSH
jgi:hypothetical protein